MREDDIRVDVWMVDDDDGEVVATIREEDDNVSNFGFNDDGATDIILFEGCDRRVDIKGVFHAVVDVMDKAWIDVIIIIIIIIPTFILQEYHSFE